MPIKDRICRDLRFALCNQKAKKRSFSFSNIFMNDSLHMESLIAVENTSKPSLAETGFTSRDEEKLAETPASTSRKLKSEKSLDFSLRNEERDAGCSGNNRKVSVLRQNKVSASKFIANESRGESEAESPYVEYVKGKKTCSKKTESSFNKNKK
jgi:hypothetical protein